LGFGNDNRAFARSLFGKTSGVSVGGVDFRKIVELRTKTPGCQTVPDSLKLERSVYPRNPLVIVRFKKLHSS
jgi:hypothetical protein